MAENDPYFLTRGKAPFGNWHQFVTKRGMDEESKSSETGKGDRYLLCPQTNLVEKKI